MHTPATGFLRSLPDTLTGIEAELVTKRDRLIDDLARVEDDLAQVRAILAVTLTTGQSSLMLEAPHKQDHTPEA
jgi:hypothetical protein